MNYEITHPCDFCENGVSDYNGRIVCEQKYVYPSFQDYSYHMFGSDNFEKVKNLSVMRADIRGFKMILLGILTLLLSFIVRLFY